MDMQPMELICDCQILTNKTRICIYAFMYMHLFIFCMCKVAIFISVTSYFYSGEDYYFSCFVFIFRPELFSWDKVLKMSPVERLEHAFSTAKNHLGIEKLLDPEGGI